MLLGFGQALFKSLEERDCSTMNGRCRCPAVHMAAQEVCAFLIETAVQAGGLWV